MVDSFCTIHHPLSTIPLELGEILTQIRGAQAIVNCLEREGIEFVFGIPGLYNMPIFDALYRHPTIRVITVRHEQGAAFMADGYARVTGKPAAVLTLPGPGLTNAMTGIGEAFYDSQPMLVLSTQVNREFIDQDRGLLHEMTRQFEMLQPLTKSGERINDGSEIAAVFQRAMAALRYGRPRPVQIEIPRDIQVEMTEWNEAPHPNLPLVRGGTVASQTTVPSPSRGGVGRGRDLADIAALLAQSQRPLIFAGGGTNNPQTSQALVKLAERLGAPVLTTGMGVGAIPSDHPLACGVPWIAAGDPRPLVAACDAFIAVGTRFNLAFTANWNLPLPETTLRIDIDPDEIERNLPMKYKVVGDGGEVLTAIDDLLAGAGLDRQGQVSPQLAAAQATFRQQITAKVGKTMPWMQALRAALPRAGILACDMSLFWADMLAAFPIYQPRTMLFPWGFGTLGFALPEAIGAKLAAPERPVLAIVGDGGFLFTGAELATAVQYRLPIPILVPNNHAYGMIKVQQRDQYDEQFMAVDLTNPDFVALAHAYGAYGVKATTPTAMAAAITSAFAADKPTLIEIPWGWTWGNEG